MRRTTAALLLSLSLLAATPMHAASVDRSFGSRIRSAVHRILRQLGTNADWLTPPKP